MDSGRMELFGPDLGRGPFTSQRIETAALQLGTVLAQLRAPLSRSDNDVRAHADFIRELADRLAPDWAAQIAIDVGDESNNVVQSTITAITGTYSLLECWLADSAGGGESGTAAASVTWSPGTLLETVTANKHYRIITPSTGVAVANVGYSGAKSWYWAVCRQGRVYYSSAVHFT
jgi:hypothetical protein